jgi:hypothetical protein
MEPRSSRSLLEPAILVPHLFGIPFQVLREYLSENNMTNQIQRAFRAVSKIRFLILRVSLAAIAIPLTHAMSAIPSGTPALKALALTDDATGGALRQTLIWTGMGPTPDRSFTAFRRLTFQVDIPENATTTLHVPITGNSLALTIDGEHPASKMVGHYISVLLKPGRHEGSLAPPGH